MNIGGYTINRKTKIYSVSDDISDARRTGLYGFDKSKPYAVGFTWDCMGRKAPNYRYFADMETAIQYRDAIKQLITA